MSRLTERGETTPTRLALWAWLAVACVPVWLVLAVVIGFTGEGQGGGARAGGVLLSVVTLAVPTVAVVLAVRAFRAGQGSARAAVVVSVLELLAVGVGLPTLVVSLGPFLVALAIYVVCVLAVAVYARGRDLTR